MAGMPLKYQHLKTKLRIEQSRMLLWGEKIGLVEERLDRPSRILSMNRNLILDILVEIHACFSSAVKVTAQYDRLLPPEQCLVEASTSPLSQVSLLRRSLDRPKSGMARLQWAVIKQERFEGLVEKLMGFNNSMESFLDQSMLDSLRAQQEQSNLILLQVTDQIEQLQALVDALQFSPSRAGMSRVTEISYDGSTIAASDKETIQMFDLAQFKLEQKTVASQPEDTQDLLLSFNSLFPHDCPPRERRSFTALYGKDLWVEWTEPVPTIPSIPNLAQILEGRVGNLAATLNSTIKPSSFRSPRCLGYIRNDTHDLGTRFGLVYHASLQNASGDQASIISLHEVMLNRPKPSLNLRISLACKLAESLMYLHTVNWLHKGLESDSILFVLPKSRSWQPSDLEEPIISGFGFSRPDFGREMTVKWSIPIEQQIYRHPILQTSLTTRSQKSHDIYSLGLVLLEIAFWKPIEEIAAIPMKSSEVTMLREILLREEFRDCRDLRSTLGAEVGDDYAEATYCCIKGGELLGVPDNVDETDSGIGGALLQTYGQEVLSRLRLSRL